MKQLEFTYKGRCQACGGMGCEKFKGPVSWKEGPVVDNRIDFIDAKRKYGGPVKHLPQRFWEKVERTASCWIWHGALGRDKKVGVFSSGDGTQKRANRLVYDSLCGDIQYGTVVYATCGTHKCVNPDHLEQVSIKEHKRRCPPNHANKKKTHCIRGHEYAGDNLIVDKKGHRSCRECRKIFGKRQARKQKRERNTDQWT